MVRYFAVVCAVAVLASSCSAAEPESSSTPATPSAAPTSTAARPTPTPTPTPTATPIEPEDACGGSPFDPRKVRALDPDGPAYTGKGLHPARLVTLHFAEDPYITRLPNAWDANDLKNQVEAQLLVCAYFDETYRQRTVDTCRYEDSDSAITTSKLLSARYRYRVFEIRTGRQVATFTLLGTRDSCPGIAPVGASVSYDQIVADADLAAKLRPFVVGPAT